MKDPSSFISIEDTTVIYERKNKKFSTEILEGWKTFAYVFFVDHETNPDPRCQFLPIEFCFALPREEAQRFGKALAKDINLIEDVFQNVYPGLTKEGGGMTRMMVDKVRVLDVNSSEEISLHGVRGFDKYMKRFSHPVGETQWPHLPRGNF